MAGLTTILVAIVGYVAAYAKNYFNKKSALLEQQLGKNETDLLRELAKDVFYIVEQQYKNVPNMANAKMLAFNQLLMQKIPGLTQAQIDHLRESIVGEINSQIK